VTDDPLLVGAVRRAELVTTEGGRRLPFHYNPSTLNVVKTADWTKPRTPGQRSIAKPQFVGCTGRTLNLTIMLDALDTPSQDVAAAVDLLLEWTTSTDHSWRTHKPQPPLLRLHWGGYQYFPGYLSSVNATYLLFSPEGKPLRASVVLAMDEVPDDPKPQNPTSGGVPDRRAVRLGGGDSLASLARQEYGDPNLWRALAVANGVDDPMSLTPGQALVVPPLGEARDLAGARRA
jgi:hypothetical protein